MNSPLGVLSLFVFYLIFNHCFYVLYFVPSGLSVTDYQKTTTTTKTQPSFTNSNLKICAVPPSLFYLGVWRCFHKPWWRSALRLIIMHRIFWRCWLGQKERIKFYLSLALRYMNTWRRSESGDQRRSKLFISTSSGLWLISLYYERKCWYQMLESMINKVYLL